MAAENDPAAYLRPHRFRSLAKAGTIRCGMRGHRWAMRPLLAKRQVVSLNEKSGRSQSLVDSNQQP
jgi:hypothetical protein